MGGGTTGFVAPRHVLSTFDHHCFHAAARVAAEAKHVHTGRYLLKVEGKDLSFGKAVLKALAKHFAAIGAEK